jgi:hypothetical protein
MHLADVDLYPLQDTSHHRRLSIDRAEKLISRPLADTSVWFIRGLLVKLQGFPKELLEVSQLQPYPVAAWAKMELN